MTKFLFQVPYPNNLLRNVGRSSVLPGHYVFVVDVDMMCNGNLYQSFLGLAQRLNLFTKNNGNIIDSYFNSRLQVQGFYQLMLLVFGKLASPSQLYTGLLRVLEILESPGK